MVLSTDKFPAARNKEINIKLVIEYDGKNYFGWQRQKDKPTIQETIENSLQILFPGNKIRLTGAGRTDTGVHASNQTANFRVFAKDLRKLGMKRLVHSLNAMLPPDISVRKAVKVNPSFHSRYSAKRRVYKYYISLKKRALNRDKICYINQKFDIDLAKEFCKLLEGNHNFRTFCKNKTDEHDFRAVVFYAKLTSHKDGIIEFEICASRFLHSMVRAIIGMMFKIASSKITLEEFENRFIKGEPFRIQYVPSNALILDKVIY